MPVPVSGSRNRAELRLRPVPASGHPFPRVIGESPQSGEHSTIRGVPGRPRRTGSPGPPPIGPAIATPRRRELLRSPDASAGGTAERIVSVVAQVRTAPSESIAAEVVPATTTVVVGTPAGRTLLSTAPGLFHWSPESPPPRCPGGSSSRDSTTDVPQVVEIAGASPMSGQPLPGPLAPPQGTDDSLPGNRWGVVR